MVGATDIAEFAWAIENLLNKIIENTLQRSPAILATMRDATAIAGELVNALEAGQGAPAKAQAIVDRAHALAANKAGASAQTATMEILERTLETRRDDVDRRHRPRAHVAGRPCRDAGARRAAADPPDSASEIHRSRRGLGDERPGQGGENIVLSAPEEEASADLQLREIYSRETQVNIAAVLRYVEGEEARNCAARRQRRGLSRLPHAVRQLAHGRGAPRHPPHRAARALGAQVFRQRRRPRSLGPRIARRLHERHAVGRGASR